MYTPLTDCTKATIQAMNRANNVPSSAKFPLKVMTHNPYKGDLVSPEDSGLFTDEYAGLSSETSPVTWYSESYSAPASPYSYKEAKLSRTLFNDYNNKSFESENSHNISTTAATPLKGVGKIYVGGRPMPVRRPQCAQVKISLRSGEAECFIQNISAILGTDVDINDLMGRFVIVEGDRGEDMGFIIDASEVNEQDTNNYFNLSRVIRVANHYDIMQYDELDVLEDEALHFCRACQEQVQISSSFTIEAAVFQFDRKKLVIKYKSDSYIDFRELTRLLHNRYKCRIWMDQLNREARIDKKEKDQKEHKRVNLRKK